MRIGIDARFGCSGGIDRYILKLLAYLSRIDRENEYIIYVSPFEFMSRLDLGRNFTVVPLAQRKYHPMAPVVLSQRIKRDKIDVFHSASYWMVPLFAGCAQVVTVHDTLALEGRTNTFLAGVYGRVMNNIAVRKSSRIVTVSDYTKEALLKFFPACAGKTATIHHGVDPGFRPLGSGEAGGVLERYGLRGDYLLYVGNLKGHKNIPNMVEAFSLLPENIKKGHPLVLVGGSADSGLEGLLKRCGLREGEDVRFIPYLENTAELVAFYNGARAFVFPSLVEYFGFPLIEAMACDIPVACSDGSCFPEIAGDAALYFDPHSVKEMAAKLERVIMDGPLRAGLVKRGRERASGFTWEKAARKNLEIYESLGR